VVNQIEFCAAGIVRYSSEELASSCTSVLMGWLAESKMRLEKKWLTTSA
jgi:hypothetical protein